MATTLLPTTAADLLREPPPGRCELVRGEIVLMSPAGFEHGRIISRLTSRLQQFVEQNSLGIVTGAETGFHIGRNPDTVRAPDVAFVRASRSPTSAEAGFFVGAPDLAVEVLSPHDRASEVLAKVQDWLSAGTELVWVVDPAAQSISTYETGGQTHWLSSQDALTAGNLLPAFRVSVAEIFAR